MSLFERAQKIVSDKLEKNKSPMLSVSMGGLPMTDKMQTYMNRPVLPNTPAGKMDGSPFMEAAEKRGIPTTNKNMNMMVDLVNRGVPLQEAANLTEQKLMPMAQGGGLSSVQNSLNINGQPHRLAYINPSEADLLKQLGGSGREVNGIPAYFDGVGMGDGTTGGPGPGDPGEDSDPASAEEGIGIGFDTSPSDTAEAVANAQAEEQAYSEAVAEQDAYSNSPQSYGLGFGGHPGAPGVASPNAQGLQGIVNQLKNKLSKPETVLDLALSPFIPTYPLRGVAKTVGSFLDSIGLGGKSQTADETATEMDEEALGFGGLGGDDYIIKKKIAEAKQVPIEEVTAEEVERVERLTNAQRVAGTRLEDILNDIYGPGQGAEMLGFNSDNANEGTA